MKKRESFKDKQALTSNLYEKIYKLERELGDLQTLIQGYSIARLAFFENMKKNAVVGILDGSKSFIEMLIEEQGSSECLIRLKE